MFQLFFLFLVYDVPMLLLKSSLLPKETYSVKSLWNGDIVNIKGKSAILTPSLFVRLSRNRPSQRPIWDSKIHPIPWWCNHMVHNIVQSWIHSNRWIVNAWGITGLLLLPSLLVGVHDEGSPRRMLLMDFFTFTFRADNWQISASLPTILVPFSVLVFSRLSGYWK